MKIIYCVFILIYISFSPLFAQWEKTTLNNVMVSCFAIDGEKLFAGTYYNGVFISTDNGLTWDSTSDGHFDKNILSLIISNGVVYKGTQSNGVYHSTDYGANWLPFNTGLRSYKITCFVNSDSGIFAGTDGGVFLLKENGTQWNFKGLSRETTSDLYISDRYLFGATEDEDARVYKSTNYGTTWDSTFSFRGSYPYLIIAMDGFDNYLFVTTFGMSSPLNYSPEGIFISSDTGVNWIYNPIGATSFAFHQNNIFAGTWEGVYQSTDYGNHWIGVNDGLIDSTIGVLCIHNGYLYAGTFPDGLWKRPLSEMITNVPSPNDREPNRFYLSQNYPNPFNPSTKIEYTILKESDVTIKIFDILGREIATPLNEKKQIGEYSLTWKTEGVPSGVYYYRLVAGAYTETKKMILMK